MIKPIKTGLCAFGMSGKVFHAPFLTTLPQFQLTAVVERHKSESKTHYPQVNLHRSVEALCADENVELIVINTPNVTHFDFAKKALEARKHVVLEKPFCLTTAEASCLIDLAQSQNLFLSAFQNRRWDSDFLAVQQVVNNGNLGRLVEAEFHFDRFRPGFSAKKHKETPGNGAGILFDLGPHLIDQALMLFGQPKRVFAHIAQQRTGSQVDDYFVLHLYYPGLLCTLKAGQLVKKAVPAYVLHGDKGSFIKTRSDVQEADLIAGKLPNVSTWGREPDDEAGKLYLEKDDKTVEKSILSPQGDYAFFYKGVFKSIREGQPQLVPLKETLANVQLIEAAYKSFKAGQVVTLAQ